MNIADMIKLIVSTKEDNAIKYYVNTEEIFQILHETNFTIGQCGRSHMQKELNSNIKTSR